MVNNISEVMLARRRSMGGVPDGMVLVEYLEVNENSDGYPYIDSGFVPNVDSVDISLRFQLTSLSAIEQGSTIYSASVNDNGYNSFIIRKSNNDSTSWLIYANTIAIYGGANLKLNVGEVYQLEVKSSTREYILNGATTRIYQSSKNKENTNPLLIFSRTKKLALRLYNFKVVKEGETVLDMIPVRIGNEGFMYDKVSGRLLGNSGSGRFVLGPDLI